MLVFDVKEITKRYRGAGESAVDGISLSVERGEIFGLLGPNGAGKTTLISMLCGLIRPSSGSFTICDLSYRISPRALKARIGVVPQELAIYPSLTARENLQYFGGLYNIRGKDLDQRVQLALDSLGLDGYADNRVDTFSGGMKRRVNLLAAVLHKPDVLFLDEPTVGVDVHSKKAIIAYLQALNRQGTTIVYSSHHLSEAQEFCSRVGIIESGKLLVEGTTDELISKVAGARSLEDVFIDLTRRGLHDV
ncbi:MAG: ABC transporter ATP-binding protein [Sphingobacterium sp.]|uniref:ABC transporter ATP-binding protein n=1 Tax=Sphingobacterium sp. JB170 TaxID=1434842 RepID=UPI000B3599C7|nr:ABC transporter ATP-binding protein [Sphingobacterium sp. JB170]